MPGALLRFQRAAFPRKLREEHGLPLGQDGAPGGGCSFNPGPGSALELRRRVAYGSIASTNRTQYTLLGTFRRRYNTADLIHPRVGVHGYFVGFGCLAPSARASLEGSEESKSLRPSPVRFFDERARSLKSCTNPATNSLSALKAPAMP